MGEEPGADPSPFTVSQWILQFYSASDTSAQARAQALLTQFQYSQSVFDVCMALLQQSYPAEVKFYCAAMLREKVRKEYRQLPDAVSHRLVAFLGEQIQSLSTGPAANGIVARTLCNILAALAVAQGKDAVVSTTRHALQLAAGAGSQSPEASAVTIALSILSALQDEMHTRGALANADAGTQGAVLAMVPEVVGLCWSLLQRPQEEGDDRSADLTAAAVATMRAWLAGADSSEWGACVAPGQLQQWNAALLHRLADLTQASEAKVAQAATEVLVEVFSPGLDSQDPEHDLAAAQAVAGRLLAARDSGGLASENAARSLGMVFVAIAERAPEACAGKWPEALPMAQVMLELARMPSKRVADTAFEYFSCINYVEMAARHEALRETVWEHLLPSVLQHAKYPRDFTSWADSVDMDQGYFESYRDHVLADMVETTYAVLRARCLHMLGAAAGGQDWRDVEAALFALRCVAGEVRRHLQAGPGRSGDDAGQTARFLEGLMGAVAQDGMGAGPGALSSNPHVVSACARMVGAYAKWIATWEASPLEGIVRYLMRAVTVPEAATFASRAFRDLASAGAARLASPGTCAALLDMAAGVAGMAHGAASPSVTDRCQIVEGLARVVSAVAPASLQATAAALTHPIVAQLDALTKAAEEADAGRGVGGASAASSRTLREAVSGQLLCLATAIRFLEGAHVRPHPALAMAEGAWPVLSHIVEAQGLVQDAGVCAALCEVYRRCVDAARDEAGPLTLPVLRVVVSLFERFGHADCLGVLGTLVEHLGSKEEAGLQEVLGKAMRTMVRAAVDRLSRGTLTELADRQDTVEELMSMLLKSIVFCSHQAAQLSAWPDVVRLSLTTLRMSERGPVTATAQLLSRAIGAAPPMRSSMEGVLTTMGQELVASLGQAIAHTAPRESLRPLGNLLHGLLCDPSWGPAALQGLAAALPGGATPGSDAARFLGLCQGARGHTATRFQGIVYDYGSVCRHEATGDVLLGYAM